MYLQKNRKLHEFATTNIFFFKNRHFQTCIIVKRTCTSIFSKIGLVDLSKPCTQIYLQIFANCINLQLAIRILTRCTRGVRVVFSVTRMRSSNSARINKFDFRTEKSCSVHMTVFEIVAGHNVVNWMQLLT